MSAATSLVVASGVTDPSTDASIATSAVTSAATSMAMSVATSMAMSVAMSVATSAGTSTVTSAGTSTDASGVDRVTQVLVAVAHICVAAQSTSRVQPQRPVPRQAVPDALIAQAVGAEGEHCAQVFMGPMQRVRPSVRLAHWASLTHSTQVFITPASPATRQRGRVGIDVAQSLSKLQVVVHVPTVAPVASDEVQNCPAGQWFRVGDAEHPATQRRVVASHTRPEVALPQSPSVAQPQKSAPPVVAVRQALPSAFEAQAAGIAAVQSTQVPLAHTGVAAPQSAFEAQPRQRRVAVSQMGVGAAHSLALAHGTLKVTTAEGVIPPAVGSVAVAVFEPTGSGIGGVTDHSPVTGSAVVVSVCPPTVMVTV